MSSDMVVQEMRSDSLHQLGLNNLLPAGPQSSSSNDPVGGSYLFAELNLGGDFFFFAGQCILCIALYN